MKGIEDHVFRVLSSGLKAEGVSDKEVVWSLAAHLACRGHEAGFALDQLLNFVRQYWEIHDGRRAVPSVDVLAAVRPRATIE